MAEFDEKVLDVFLDRGDQIVTPPLRGFRGGQNSLLGELLDAADGHAEKLGDDLHPVVPAASYFVVAIQIERPPPRIISPVSCSMVMSASRPSSRCTVPTSER